MDYIKSLVHQKRKEIDLVEILKIHTLILRYINDAAAGHLRTVKVRCKEGSSFIFPAPADVPVLMNDFVKWLESSQGNVVADRSTSTFKACNNSSIC